MFKVKAPDNTNNLCGKTVQALRLSHEPPLSPMQLAKKMQLLGCNVDHHFIRRLENGERFVTDIEIKFLCEALGVSYEQLLPPPVFPNK